MGAPTPAVRIVLVVGGDPLPPSLKAEGRLREIVVAYGDLGPRLLARHRPDMVVCPLVGAGFDALEVAERLASAGFRGRFCVVADGPQEGEIARAEIAASCPGVEVRLFSRADRRPAADR